MKPLAARVADEHKPKYAATAACTILSFVFGPTGTIAIVCFDGELILRPILMSKLILAERLYVSALT